MKKNITYKQLLNLSIEEFNNRKEKTINEILLYLYYCQKRYGSFQYKIVLKEIYKACIDIDRIIIPISYAFEELIENCKCDDCIDYLIDYQQAFMEESLSIDNPLKHWSDIGPTVKAFFDLTSFYFEVFEELEDWDYDLSRLMHSCEYDTETLTHTGLQ